MNVLLTGSGDFLGKLVLKRLNADPAIVKIVTVDPGRPARGKKVTHLKLGAGDEKLVPHVKKEKINTIVHLPLDAHGDFDQTVLGTMNLLGVAAEGGAHRVVLRSSTCVYGARHNNPNYIQEARRIRLGGKSPHVRHASEIERYAHDFLKHFHDVALAILRFAPIVGPTSDSPIMQYLRQDSCPVLLGFDPLFQLIHEEDAADAVVAAIKSDARGAINVAPEGVAPLLRMVRFLGKPTVPVPHPLAGLSETLLRASIPFDAAFLRYGCCGDNDRMKTDLRFVPRRSTSEALRALKA